MVMLQEQDIKERALFDQAVLYSSGKDALHFSTAMKDVIDFGSFGNMVC